MGKPEQTKRFDRKTNYDNKGWIQDRYFKNHQTQWIDNDCTGGGWGFEWGLIWYI